MTSLRDLLLRRQVLPIAVVLMAGVGLVWFESSRLAWHQADARVVSDLGHLERELGLRLREAEDLGEAVAGLWSSGRLAPRDGAGTWALLAPLLQPRDRRFAQISLVDVEGRGFLAGSRKPGKWEAWAGRLEGGRTLCSFGVDTEAVAIPHDLRERPWYLAAMRSRSGAWTDPYPLIGGGGGRPAVAYAVPGRDGGGRLVGALGVHLPLDELARSVWELRPSPGAETMILDAQGRLVVPPASTASWDAKARDALLLAPAGPGRFPLAHRIFRRFWEAGGSQRTLQVRGSERYGRGWALRAPRGPQWFLVLVLPASDVATGPRSRTFVAGSVALAVLLVHLWYSLRLARQVADPMARLADAAEALPQAVELRLPDSPIRELGSLAGALADAHAGLRERERLQEQLRQTQRLETVGTLAGGISHDVNNQLTAILGQLDIGRELLEPGHPAQEHLGLAREAAARCARTSRALLTFSRPSPPELLPLDLHEVVRETQLLLGRVLGVQVRLELDLAPVLPPVLGDRVQLEQVLVNLVMNARDAMPKGGTIRISTRADASGVDLCVSDEGVGMPPEVAARIFEPFFTTKPQGRGTGLGLSMALGIVRAHGGDITVESRPGQGSSFHVRLQVAEAGPSALEAPPEGPVALDGLRVLVVEDEAVILHTLALALAARGAQVEEAADGEEAWERFQQAPFDAVVSDHVMPRCTGLELLERLRARDPRLPVVLASGCYPEGVERRLAADPWLRLLPKPFGMARLARLLAEMALHHH